MIGVPGRAQRLYGVPLTGYWFDRTQEYAANRGEEYGRLTYATGLMILNRIFKYAIVNK